MTYTDFVARLQLLLEIDPATDADWATMLPAVIEEAELRCYGDLDPVAVRLSAAVAAAPGQPTVTLPANCNIPRELAFAALPAGAPSLHIARRDETFLAEMFPDPTVTGTPKYWALTAIGTALLAPVPADAVALNLSYTWRPTPLSVANPSTWLATWCPDLMVFAAMVWASGYQRNYGALTDDPQQGMSWEKQYQRALVKAQREEARRKGEGYFDKSAAPPPSSARPTGGDGQA